MIPLLVKEGSGVVARGADAATRHPHRRLNKVLICATGPEGRQNLAHGVSRGAEAYPSDPIAPVGAAETRPGSTGKRRGVDLLCRPSGARTLLIGFVLPRLSPWAKFCRRSAAPMVAGRLNLALMPTTPYPSSR